MLQEFDVQAVRYRSERVFWVYLKVDVSGADKQKSWLFFTDKIFTFEAQLKKKCKFFLLYVTE
jgi:hypothetical protein